MHGLKHAWKRVSSWLGYVLGPVYTSQVVQDWLPRTMAARTLYIVEDDGIAEQVAFLCPCGCGELIQLNLLPDEHPCWRLTHDRSGNLTACPSVWRTRGCRAHFWIRHSRIWWCRK